MSGLFILADLAVLRSEMPRDISLFKKGINRSSSSEYRKLHGTQMCFEVASFSPMERKKEEEMDEQKEISCFHSSSVSTRKYNL